MTRASARNETEEYPWDAVWEYILDDSNFEDKDKKHERRVWKKKTKEARPVRDSYEDDDEDDDDDDDYDSAYDEEEIRRAKEIKAKIAEYNAIHAMEMRMSKPKKTSKRFGWLSRRLRKDKGRRENQKRGQNRVTFEPSVTESRSSPSNGYREKSKRREPDPAQDDDRETFSDFGPAFFHRGDVDEDASLSGYQSATSESGSVLEHILGWGKTKDFADDISALGNQSVQSEAGSMFHLLPWGTNMAERDEHLNDILADDSSDEISVMNSLFHLQESRSDYEETERHRYRAKQRWRNMARDRSRSSGIRRTFFDARDTSSVHSSDSRLSRSSKNAFKDRRQLQDKRQMMMVDDISVASYLLETQGGSLLHVPSTIQISPLNHMKPRPRHSMQFY